MPREPSDRTVVVAAAVIEREDAFLLTRRLAGTHLAGHWEFPGGKRQAGESLEDCLRREMREELAAEIEIERPIVATRHCYPDRTVELRFFRCSLTNAPVPQLGQEMQWIPRAELRSVPLPPADEEIVELLTRRVPHPPGGTERRL